MADQPSAAAQPVLPHRPTIYFIQRPPVPSIGKRNWDWVGGYATLKEARRVHQPQYGDIIVKTVPVERKRKV